MLDWWVIPKIDEKSTYMGKDSGKQGKMVDVLLVVILNEALNKHQEVIKQANITSSFYEIEIFSTIRSVLDGGGMQPTMIVDFGAATTKLYIIERGVVRTSHTVNRGSQDITLVMGNTFGISVAEAENLKRSHGLVGMFGDRSLRDVADVVLRFIFSEANMVLINYEKKYGKNVEKVVLTGGGSTLKGVLEVAKTVFETDVMLGEPFSKVQTPAFMDPVLRQVGPEFAVALGLALRKLAEQDGV
jgi:type IV pilus assembly protein PilM